ncbi:hypothetical protein [Myxococcus sp. RHSTA-1-4]|uniref:hypothetical protein n=1 Tax=Myxococcus sp. RHSTA-1-4 TaxID=2874601 RepID=UPI001CC17F85|nr:hypothetical protein [Myxococcus sp. RHSTA-1-4]MBZ4417852.1 hypothetical protein [Myxococcus sp. RHSTA-1-4]
MRPPVHVMERLSRVAPLGLRFVDEATGTFIGDGLQVSAFPEGLPAARRQSVLNRSGIHVLMDLPGLRDLEFGDEHAGDDAWWATHAGQRPYTVEVRDTLGRFLPCAFRAELPHRKLFAPDCVSSPPSPLSPLSPNDDGPSVPLFSAPSRQAAVPLAVLRAELWDVDEDAPAAWALVEATDPGGVTVRGVADEKGRLALFFQYPRPLDFSPDFSFPAGPPLLEQTWALQIRVHYTRRTPVPELPDVCLTLSQPPAGVWTVDSGGPLALLESTLRYGQELVLRTRRPDPQAPPHPRLWITPTGSTP